MKMEDSRIIARFQCLTTGLMVTKRLGRWRPELADELYLIWLELEQRGLICLMRRIRRLGRQNAKSARFSGFRRDLDQVDNRRGSGAIGDFLVA